MKKLYTLLVFATTLTISAQAPQGFNYQATVRNNAGALIINKTVSFKFNIIPTSANGTAAYSESQTVTTDDLGQVSLVIGKGTATTGSFATIDWATGTYYLGIELNTGNGFVGMGTTQLLSVPYAMYAKSSGAAAIPNLANVLAKNNSANATKITNLADPTDAQDAATKAYVDALEERISTLENRLFININSASVIDIDNNTYNTLKYGNQIWTKENLNVSKYRNGDVIPQVTDPTQLANLTTGAWCYYNNDPANGAIYGKLYNWYAVNDPRGIAPEGWHIPTDIEWNTLTDYLGTDVFAGGKMKERGYSHWSNLNNVSGTNESGFTALPGGYTSSSTWTFTNIGINGYWWSSQETPLDNSKSWFLRLNAGGGNSQLLSTTKKSVMSIR